MQLDLTAQKRVRRNSDAASNATSVFGNENQPNTQQSVSAPCIDHHKLDELFPDGWEPCHFVTDRSRCIHFVAAYPPSKASVNEPLNNATSRNITSILKHEDYNWIDAVPFSPEGRIKNVKFNELAQLVETRPDLAQNVADRLMPLRAENKEHCLFQRCCWAFCVQSS